MSLIAGLHGVRHHARAVEMIENTGTHRDIRVWSLGLIAIALGGGSAGYDAVVFAAIGGGGRLWLDRAFIQARFEHMAISGVGCEAPCGVTVNRVSAGGGFDVLRGRQGDLELSLEINRVADHVGVTFGFGGSFHP